MNKIIFIFIFFTAFGANAELIQRGLIDLENATGGQMTVADVQSSVRGTPVTISTAGLVGMTNASFAHRELSNWAKFSPYGVFKGTGTNGLQGDFNFPTNYFVASLPVASSNASVGCWVYTDLPYEEGVNFDCPFTIFTQYAGDFIAVNLQLEGSGTQLKFALENFGAGIPVVNFQRTNWYWLTAALKVNGSNSIALYDATGTNQISRSDTAWTSTNLCSFFTFGTSHNAISSKPGYKVYIDSILYDFSDNAVFPLLPGDAAVRVRSVTNLIAGELQ